MTSTLQAPPEEIVDTPAAAPRRRLSGGRFLRVYTWLVIAWLALPS
jgi:hypothetical protein